MSLYVFNNQQKVTKVIKYKRLVEATQEIELNGTDELTVEIPNKDWNKLEEEPLYLAVRDTSKRFSFHMYKILQEDTQDDTVTVKGIQIGYDEMKAYGYIKDRRFTQASMQSVANVIVEGTDWQKGFVDSDLPAITTNFYYISRLEAIRKVIEANGCEIRFRVEITGNRIVAKRIDFLKRMSSDKGKRFSYGSKLLSVVKEKDSAELYTALVGRGKGEEVGDGYGRRIGFEGVEWSIANGDPVDKPLGQEFVELPEMTALYGFPDGEPRTGIVTFEDTEDEGLLLSQTYEQLVEVSRPQVQFKATVQLIGDAELGETVSIIRHDLNFKYKTRIFKVKRDLLNNNRTEIELGDRITESLGRTIRRIDTTNQRREERIVQYVQNTADGKNRIFRQTATPDTGMTVNDLWYKPVGEGETELYRWNGEIWQLEKVSAGLLGGTLDAENGDVNLINVNVANIVGETSEFVRSAWNTIGAGVTIDGNGILSVNESGGTTNEARLSDGSLSLQSNITGDTRRVRLDGAGLVYTTDIRTGRIRFNGTNFVFDTNIGLYGNHINSVSWIGLNSSTTHLQSHPTQSGSALVDGSRLALGNGTRDNFEDIMVITSGIINGYRNLNMRDNWIESVQRLVLHGSTTELLTASDNTSGVLRSGQQLILGIRTGSDISNTSARITIGGRIDMHRNAWMNGNTLYGQIGNESDRRLKDNVHDADQDSLSIISGLDFVEYEWKNKGVYGPGMQFGLIAQDVDESLILHDKDSDIYSINSSRLTLVSAHALKQLAQKVHDLELKLEGMS